MVKETERPACTVKPRTPLVLPPGLPDERMRLIRMLSSKWVNGTVLHYWFLDGPAAQQQAVRDAFAEWKALGIGLVFTEVQDRSEAEVRIGFDQADGSWSYVGRDVLGIPATEPTMNFGWDLTTDYGHTTALHEIGHTLGLPHEHQNPFAGIVWDEQKVYDYFGGSPNFWPREQTFSQCLAQARAHRGRGFHLGSQLGDGVLVPRRADHPARAVPRRAGARRRALGHRQGVDPALLPETQGHEPAAEPLCLRTALPGARRPGELQHRPERNAQVRTGRPSGSQILSWCSSRRSRGNSATWRPTTTAARTATQKSR